MKRIVFFSCLLIISACSGLKKPIEKAQVRRASTPPLPVNEKKSNNSILGLRSRFLLIDSTKVKVYLEIEMSNIAQGNIYDKFKDSFRINWLLLPDYGQKDRLANGQVTISPQNFIINDDNILLTYEIPRHRMQATGLLLTEITDEIHNTKATNDLTINFDGLRIQDRFGIFQNNSTTPLFKNYIAENDTFYLRSLQGSAQNFRVTRYVTEFEPAASPMSSSNKNIDIINTQSDTIFNISANMPISFNKAGLYYIAAEDSSKGFGLLVVNNRFPRLSQAKQLTQPLLYMSTNQEIQELRANPKPKEALDTYFLNLAHGDEVLARRIIKTYYRRIETANRLFTTYKQGWKTDKGMIYTILGPPSKVQKSKAREIWTYGQMKNFSEAIFTFNKKSNQFTDHQYELVRYPEYQAYWYPIVEAWRTGNILE